MSLTTLPSPQLIPCQGPCKQRRARFPLVFTEWHQAVPRWKVGPNAGLRHVRERGIRVQGRRAEQPGSHGQWPLMKMSRSSFTRSRAGACRLPGALLPHI